MLAVLVVGVLTAVAIVPLVGGVGVAVTAGSETIDDDLADIDENQSLPQVTTVTDRNGDVMARLYDQRRYMVESDEIAEPMKQAIVAIEDRRFYEHDGVDVRGTLRALAANFSSGGVEQGASTLDQQYIKNYLLLIDAADDEERAAATETSVARKLREMKMAINLEENYSKDEILTRYLNLVPFGNGAYGVESAARTYFGIPASELSVSQSAMLAGMVQSTSLLNPYTNPDGVMDRREAVLDAMVNTGDLGPEERARLGEEPLGIEESPNSEPNGCIGAGNAGFYCDYVLSYLANHDLDTETLARGGYTIRTALDPDAQDAAVRATRNEADPTAGGVSLTSNYIAPTDEGHEVVAMASSRRYGLDSDHSQTVLPVTHSSEGNGAGSVFKIFAAAAAMEEGMGLDTMLQVPSRIDVEGMGTGGAEGCPPNRYCVGNAGEYKSQMTLREALATSPNTPFVRIAEQLGTERMTEIAVKLGLRSYAEEGSYDGDQSIADFVTDSNLGSFVLGPLEVNPIELSNVSASLADHGRWCEPSPVLSVTDNNGEDVALDTPDCEQAIDRKVADALANGMGGDVSNGTAASAASSAGWRGPVSAKTGTTETSLSAAFLGFTPGLAGSTYAFNDGSQTSPLCSSPLRQCGDGNLFGGNEPARAFFSAMSSMVGDYGGSGLPRYDRGYDRGDPEKYRRATSSDAGSSNNQGGNQGAQDYSAPQSDQGSQGWDMSLDEFD
ncbi:MAG TPA: penicillin-binding protein [Candidatus Corynebacterium avicola]|uniref:Penicillin-binding protein n=1 Tax=Candidatus Corynebacterium avicola TaxID=2838527 RepID=A0A9D1RSR9_9CORY|nr:penicillin-binding protein [Candidatus Corynebacterium avicola]